MNKTEYCDSIIVIIGGIKVNVAIVIIAIGIAFALALFVPLCLPDIIEKKIDKDIKLQKISCNTVDILNNSLMQLRLYHKACRLQAIVAFIVAIIACFIGLICYVVPIINGNTTVITVVSGSVSEVITALFFTMYNTANKQQNIYYDKLEKIQVQLLAIQLVENMTEGKKDEQYQIIISKLMAS